MSISLYDVSVGSYLQTLEALAGVLDKAASHFKDKNIDPDVIVGTRMFPDMLPFRFQVMQVAFHALASVEAMKTGTMSPPSGPRPTPDFAGLQATIAEAIATLKTIDRDTVEAADSRDIVFTTSSAVRVFTAPDFILGFTLPNLHFHAATAYDILRQAGVSIGKRDFIGQPRVKETR